MVRITVCHQAEWGPEMKIKLSYRKRNVYSGVYDLRKFICNTRVLSLSDLTLRSHSAQNFDTFFLQLCLKRSDKWAFCCFNWSYFERAEFRCHVASIILCLISMTHKHPPHSLPTSGSVDGLRCSSQIWAASEVASLSWLAQGSSSFSNTSPVSQESFQQSQGNQDGGSPLHQNHLEDLLSKILGLPQSF